MRSLSVDSIGPLPADQFGNEHILVVIDDFTRFVELYAIKDVSALEAAKVLLNHLGRYGVPTKLRSDRGSQFVNDVS
jgi:transposase InsO family protein